MGNTERLSSLNGLRQVPKEQEEESAMNLKVPKNDDNLEHGDSDVESCQIQSGKRSQNSFNQKGRAEDLDSKGEDSGDDQQVTQMKQYKIAIWIYIKFDIIHYQTLMFDILYSFTA